MEYAKKVSATLLENTRKQAEATMMLEQAVLNTPDPATEPTLAGVAQILVKSPRPAKQIIEQTAVEAAVVDPTPPTGMVQKDGAWFEIVIPSAGDPNAAQKKEEADAKTKRMMWIGGFILLGLILLILFVKAVKKKMPKPTPA